MQHCQLWGGPGVTGNTGAAQAEQPEAPPAAAACRDPRLMGRGPSPACRGADPVLVAAGGKGGSSARSGSEQPQTTISSGGAAVPPPRSTPDLTPREQSLRERRRAETSCPCSHHLRARQAAADNGESFWLASEEQAAPQKPFPGCCYQPWGRAASMGRSSIDAPGAQHSDSPGALPPRGARPAPRGRTQPGSTPSLPKVPRCRRVPGMLAWPRVQPGLKAARYALLGGGGLRAPSPTRRGSALPPATMHRTRGNEGGKGQEKEYIPSRTVNHAE